MKLSWQLLFFFFFLPLFGDDGVASFLSQYTRAFSCLQIGEGEFVDPNQWEEGVFVFFKETPPQSNAKNQIWLQKKPLPSDLKRIKECEHFDLIIFNLEDEDSLEIAKEMGSNLYFKGVFLKNSAPFDLKRTTLIHPYKKERSYTIESNFEEKVLIKKQGKQKLSSDFFAPGINVMTYCFFNGAIPSRLDVVNAIPLSQAHTDWIINNMILQGENILLIDDKDSTASKMGLSAAEFAERALKNSEFILLSKSLSFDEFKKLYANTYGFGNYFEQEEIDQ